MVRGKQRCDLCRKWVNAVSEEESMTHVYALFLDHLQHLFPVIWIYYCTLLGCLVNDDWQVKDHPYTQKRKEVDHLRYIQLSDLARTG
jgi:hypothetical protein